MGEAERESGAALYEAMMQNSTKVIELFKFLDQNEDGAVSKKEFRRAPALLGIKMPATEVDALFDLMDYDDSGDITTAELGQALTPSLTLTPPYP